MNKEATPHKTYSISELANITSGSVIGDTARQVIGVCSIDEPLSGCITFTRESDSSKLTGKLNNLDVAAVFVHKSQIPGISTTVAMPPMVTS